MQIIKVMSRQILITFLIVPYRPKLNWQVKDAMYIMILKLKGNEIVLKGFLDYLNPFNFIFLEEILYGRDN